jgi:hypothetical protein
VRLTLTNSFDFIQKVKDTQELKVNEVLVSFDVISLFSSIPIDLALQYMTDWLISRRIETNKISCYDNVMKCCKKENFYKFRNRIYNQTEGTSLGSCLSHFIGDIFMKKFESDLMPPHRHQHNSDMAQFTSEGIEKNNQFHFLDVMVETCSNKLTFDVYRKLTSTRRYITADSFHPQSHKNAVFHSMAHRLCNFELSPEKFAREKATIIEIGRTNGYPAQNMRKIIDKHVRNSKPRSITTLSPTKVKQKKRTSIPFYRYITNKIKKVSKHNDIKLVTSSSGYKLKDKFESTKDPKLTNHKSGMYEIQCGTRNCSYKYIGQT